MKKRKKEKIASLDKKNKKGIKNLVSWETRTLKKKCQGMEKKDIKTF